MITGQWIPLVPSVLIEAGEVEQFLVEDKDVAVWRSMQGHVKFGKIVVRIAVCV